MQEGRVVQCGEPEEVYERPTATFVADFIGISNLIEGTAEDGGRVRIGSGMRVPAPIPDGCAAGEPVRIVVRPEKIALDEVEPGMVTLRGVVERRVYLGMTSQVTVSLGAGARLVALEQLTYRARADDRWEPALQ
jgi:spermidine/putrescine transport system ATP-binding protein